VLSIAVAEDRLLPVADDTIVLFAGTATIVPGGAVVKASLVARVLEISLLEAVTETSLLVSDKATDVPDTLSLEPVALVPLSVEPVGKTLLSV
jgi:hypothetical protein